MDNLKNVAFQLERYWFEEASLHLNDNTGEQKINIDFKPSGVYHKDNGLYKLSFVFTAWEEGKEETDFTIRLKCNGYFRFQKAIGVEEIPGFFFPNSIAILFPYVRAFVSTLTLQANVSPMLLPTINLSPLQDALRKNTIVK